MKLFVALFFFFYSIPQLSSSEDGCNSIFTKYDLSNCRVYWDCTIRELLSDWKLGINRTLIYDMDVRALGHTPMRLRIVSGKLYCVPIKNKNFRFKIYRALHYVYRLNRILRKFPKTIPDATEWLSHHSDWVKVPRSNNYPPVFAVSGDKSHNDIPGIPFMSFSDLSSKRESIIFKEYHDSFIPFHHHWRSRSSSAFFRGSLSDCATALSTYHGDLNYCARAKVVLEAARVQDNLLSGIQLIKGTYAFDELNKCSVCQGDKLNAEDFVVELHKHKYLINFAGAGNWSRRMSLLLRSGGMIVHAESPGYQFYDFRLKPGVHYIPFDPDIGHTGAGNLISRLEWARNNDIVAEGIARRSETFGRVCLSERSIDYFVSKLLGEYGALLRGASKKEYMIDLSPCICKGERCKPSKLCEGVIDSCWS